MKTLVLGIGNTLLTDEGVGVHVLQALAPELVKAHPQDVAIGRERLEFMVSDL